MIELRWARNPAFQAATEWHANLEQLTQIFSNSRVAWAEVNLKRKMTTEYDAFVTVRFADIWLNREDILVSEQNNLRQGSEFLSLLIQLEWIMNTHTPSGRLWSCISNDDHDELVFSSNQEYKCGWHSIRHVQEKKYLWTQAVLNILFPESCFNRWLYLHISMINYHN